MSKGVNGSANNVRFENEGLLETSLGGWKDELRNIPLLVTIHFIIIFVLPLLIFFGIFLIFREGADSVLENIELIIFAILFLQLLSIIAPLIQIYEIYLIAKILRSRTDHRRHYIVFKLLSSSDKESGFSLSSLNSLLLSSFFIYKYEAKKESTLEKSWYTPSSSATNKIQLSKLKIKSDNPFSFLYPFVSPFLIASQGGRNVDNTFIFYSRHRSCWDKVQQHLSSYNLGIEILHSEEMRS